MAEDTITRVYVPQTGFVGIEQLIVFENVTVSEVRDGHLYISSPNGSAVFSPGHWLRAQTEKAVING